MRNLNGYYTKLRNSRIIGYIDHLDSVQSRSFGIDDRLESVTHEDLFGKVLKGWRWDYDRGLEFSIYASGLSDEDFELIRNHLEKKYKIPFYENGYHDVDFFCKKMDEEEKN
jgi:hypothetical protein